MRGKRIICQVKETSRKQKWNFAQTDVLKCLLIKFSFSLIYSDMQKSKGMVKIQIPRSVFMLLKAFKPFRDIFWRSCLHHRGSISSTASAHWLHAWVCHVVLPPSSISHLELPGERQNFLSNILFLIVWSYGCSGLERWPGIHCFVLLVLSCKGQQRKEETATLKHWGIKLGSKTQFEFSYICESDLVNIRTVLLHAVLDLERFSPFFSWNI